MRAHHGGWSARRLARATLGLVVVVAGIDLAGCAATQQARYVYQDGEYGVIGVPENSDRWPTYYRRHAEALMEAHFPEGYEIVRAEEVVDGSRTRTRQGSRTAEVSPQLPLAVVQAVKVGGSRSTSEADTTTLKEARIIYKRRPPHEIPDHDFTDQPTENPVPYVNPNAAALAKLGPPPAPADANARATSGSPTPAARPDPALAPANLKGAVTPPAASDAAAGAPKPHGGPLIDE